MAERTGGPPIEIRMLQAHELDAYKALRDAMLVAFPEAYTSDAPTEARKAASDYRSRIRDAAVDTCPYTLAVWQGTRLVGAASVESDQRLKVRHIGHLAGMMVLPDAQGRGIGAALLDACIAEARRIGTLDLLTLSVTASNAAASTLYERRGFVRYGTLRRAIRLGDTFLDKHLMAYTL